MLHPRVIGNPADIGLIDDDPLRGRPRDAGELSESIQYELGHNEEFQSTFVASDRSMSRQKRPTSRP
eukprot:9399390-Pyramimonas_sp.AAC.1